MVIHNMRITEHCNFCGKLLDLHIPHPAIKPEDLLLYWLNATGGRCRECFTEWQKRNTHKEGKRDKKGAK